MFYGAALGGDIDVNIGGLTSDYGNFSDFMNNLSTPRSDKPITVGVSLYHSRFFTESYSGLFGCNFGKGNEQQCIHFDARVNVATCSMMPQSELLITNPGENIICGYNGFENLQLVIESYTGPMRELTVIVNGSRFIGDAGNNMLSSLPDAHSYFTTITLDLHGCTFDTPLSEESKQHATEMGWTLRLDM